MKNAPFARLSQINFKQYLALALSVALGGLLVAGLLFGLKPLSAAAAVSAAGPAASDADPAAVYNCNVAGLDLALSTGGSATFNCVGPTTLIITPSRTVIHNVTLDGGNKLILSGNQKSQVFSVTAGIHLTLLNLTIRDANAAAGGGVFNNGILNVTAVQFISNTAAGGAAIFNAPGGVANLSSATVISSGDLGGAIWNGDQSVPTSATLTVANSTFIHNTGTQGAAIFNENGPVTVTGSSFTGNFGGQGGAIDNLSLLNVQNSQFTSNFATSLAIDSLAQLKSLPNAPSFPAGIIVIGGGAIYNANTADAIIKGSTFTDNVSSQGGGAILFGVLPSGLLITPTGASLSIDSSTLSDNCGGTGGAIATSQRTSLSNSILNENFADSGSSPCIAWAASRPNGPRPGTASGPDAPVVVPPPGIPGTGGAIFSAINLSVDNTTFMTNTATVTSTGGGGAISNFTLGVASVFNDRFADNQATQDGGAIYNSDGGTFTVNSSQFRTNHALNDAGGAIASQGALTVTQSSFTANYGAPGHGALGGGGAIFNGLPFVVSSANGPASGSGRPPQVPQGTLGPPTFLYLDHSTFVSNSSQYEGGAVDAGPALVSASSFMSNTAANGGAIDVWQSYLTLTNSSLIANSVITTGLGTLQGGAIDGNSWAVTILNSTFYQNHAEGAATGGALNSDFGGTVAITNSTFLSNTADTAGNGGTFSHGPLILANSSGGNRPSISPPVIVLHNVLLAFSGGGDCDSAVTLNGANLEFPDNSCGSASVQLDPKALPPADNGGPTLTSALLPSSPAINAGDDAGCPGTDQRGAHRPVGSHCDIGAFEFGGLVPRLWLPAIR